MKINVIGVDIGGSGMDQTAIAISTITPTLSQFTEQSRYYDRLEYVQYGPPYQYEVRHLERLPLGTNTPEAALIVKEMTQKIQGNMPVLVDVTASGRTGIEPFLQAGLSCIAVTITGGDSISADGLFIRTPKRDLIGNLKIAFETGEMRIARSLPDAEILIRELMAFRMKPNISTYAGDIEEWREGKSDDLVFAVALSCFGGRWLFERSGPILINREEMDYQISPV